jgi:hypothetical protein
MCAVRSCHPPVAHAFSRHSSFSFIPDVSFRKKAQPFLPAQEFYVILTKNSNRKQPSPPKSAGAATFFVIHPLWSSSDGKSENRGNDCH